MNPAPVAAPRRNIFSEPTEATEKDNEDTLEYDDLLNPFGDGDSNDTSLSFSSSSDEEDDNNNPFEDDSDLKKVSWLEFWNFGWKKLCSVHHVVLLFNDFSLVH